MTIINEAVRLFFAMTALILVGLLSAPMSGDLNFQPTTKGNVTKLAAGRTADAKELKAKKKKISAKKIAAEQKLKLRKS